MFFIAKGLAQKNMATKEKGNRRKNSAAKKEKNSTKDFSVELSEPLWSVVSFEESVAANLTYAAALSKLKQLEAKKVSGLCIVTDEAAARISNNGER